MIYRAIILLSFVLCSSNAYADFGDLSVGGSLGLGDALVHQDDLDDHGSQSYLLVQPEITLRIGLLDWLHLDTGLGVVAFNGGPYASADIGLTFVLDIFTLVPELKLGLFFLFLPDDDWQVLPGFDAAVALRYHLNPSWSVALGAELNLTMIPRRQGILSFLYVID